MAHPREIEDFRKDPDKWRLTLRQLLHYDRDALTDEFVDFAERVLALAWLEEISYRQGEWTLGVRDDLKFVPTYRQFSLRALAQACFESRLDLSEADQEWIEKLVDSGRTEFRLRDARHIYRLARQLGEVDQDEEAA